MLKAAVYLVNNEEIGVQLHDNEPKIELTRETMSLSFNIDPSLSLTLLTLVHDHMNTYN